MFMNAKNGAGSKMSEGGCWPVAWATRLFLAKQQFIFTFFFHFNVAKNKQNILTFRLG